MKTDIEKLLKCNKRFIFGNQCIVKIYDKQIMSIIFTVYWYCNVFRCYTAWEQGQKPIPAKS